MGSDPDNRYRYLRLVGSLGTIPTILAVGPLIGFFGGRWLDRRLGTGSWLQFILLGLGFAAAVRYTVRLLKRVQKDIDKL